MTDDTTDFARPEPKAEPGTLPTDRVAREHRNHFAFLSLFMGICAWVPLMILFCAPLSFIFAGAAFLTAKRRKSNKGIGGAWAGMFLSVIAIGLHLGFALFASIIGWTGAWIGSLSGAG
jgi:hypothetical protein